ncbi:uncharacterized protein [Prorops nasuta]|uniref:uncharacterized protein n=1 Tax=Prorops nasuta TaxID=863751 RepID=UPI0034D01A92
MALVQTKGKVSIKKKCMYRNCENIRDEVDGDEPYWFRFPGEKDPRFLIWLKNCGCMDLLNKYKTSSIRQAGICSKHFKSTEFTTPCQSKLKRTAIPISYEEESSNSTNHIRTYPSCCKKNFKTNSVNFDNTMSANVSIKDSITTLRGTSMTEAALSSPFNIKHEIISESPRPIPIKTYSRARNQNLMKQGLRDPSKQDSWMCAKHMSIKPMEIGSDDEMYELTVLKKGKPVTYGAFTHNNNTNEQSMCEEKMVKYNFSSSQRKRSLETDKTESTKINSSLLENIRLQNENILLKKKVENLEKENLMLRYKCKLQLRKITRRNKIIEFACYKINEKIEKEQ